VRVIVEKHMMQTIHRISFLFLALSLAACTGSRTDKTVQNRRDTILLQAISFQIEGDELIEEMTYMAAAGASGSNAKELIDLLGINMSSLIFMIPLEDVADKGIHFYDHSENPRNVIQGEYGREYLETYPWDFYILNRLFAGKSIVDIEHISSFKELDDGYLRYEFNIPKIVSGTFFINPDGFTGVLNPSNIFLKQQTELDTIYIPLTNLFHEKFNTSQQSGSANGP